MHRCARRCATAHIEDRTRRVDVQLGPVATTHRSPSPRPGGGANDPDAVGCFPARNPSARPCVSWIRGCDRRPRFAELADILCAFLELSCFFGKRGAETEAFENLRSRGTFLPKHHTDGLCTASSQKASQPWRTGRVALRRTSSRLFKRRGPTEKKVRKRKSFG